MIAWLLAGIVVPWFATYLFVRRCDAEAGNKAAVIALHAMLALGLALGLTSCSYFVGLLFCGAPGRAYCTVEILGFAALGLLSRLGAARPPGASIPEPHGSKVASPQGKLLRWVFLASLISATLGIAGMFLIEPHGDCDAWNIWTMRARYLFRSGQEWRNAFAPFFAHTDYPLMLSGTIARCWTYLAGERLWIPQLVAAAFTLLGAGLLTAGVARLRGTSHGWLAGLSLLGTVFYLSRGASLYADVPLSCFFLAALLLLAFYDAGRRSSPGLLVLAGLSAALAAWTKNEGLLFLAIVLVVRALLAWRRSGGRGMLRETSALLAGAAPVIMVVVLFKVSIAAENDIVAGQTWHTLLSRLTDASRIAFILKSLVETLWHVGKALVLILPLAWLLVGGASDRSRSALPGLVAVLAAMLAGYFFVYLATPHDLAWHVSSSMDRLLVHLWPSMLLAAFLYLGDPTEYIWRETSASPASTGVGKGKGADPRQRQEKPTS